MKKLILSLVILSLALSLGACKSSSKATPTAATAKAATPSATTTGAAGGGTSITVTAKSIKFDKDTITVRAGASVTIEFKNEDSGIQHNIAFYETQAAAKSIFVGDIITGNKTATYKFTAPTTPDTYFFRCDIHPNTMTGKFVVTP